MDLKVAAALLPIFKLDWVEDDDEKTKITEALKQRVEAFCEEQPKESNHSGEQNQDAVKDDRKNKFFHFKKPQKRGTARSEVREMMDNYLLSETNDDFVPILRDYPLPLKRAFIRYNTAVPSSAHVERLFSLGGLIFDSLRGRLADKNFEMALLLKFNRYL